MSQVSYQPLDPGRFGFDVHTRGLPDAHRGRTLPCDVWCPIGTATRPLVLVPHFSGGYRRSRLSAEGIRRALAADVRTVRSASLLDHAR